MILVIQFFLSFTMDKFERNVYYYYFNGLSQSLKIHMIFKYISDDPVQGNDFLEKNCLELCGATQGV